MLGVVPETYCPWPNKASRFSAARILMSYWSSCSSVATLSRSSAQAGMGLNLLAECAFNAVMHAFLLAFGLESVAQACHGIVLLRVLLLILFQLIIIQGHVDVDKVQVLELPLQVWFQGTQATGGTGGVSIRLTKTIPDPTYPIHIHISAISLSRPAWGA